MTSIERLFQLLDEQTLAQQGGIRHDTVRMGYRLNANTVANWQEFQRIIVDYYRYHYSKCVSVGGTISDTDAWVLARDMLEQQYRRRRGDINSAYNDAHDGTNGGLRAILDIIADTLKAEALERYVRAVFDRSLDPNSWEERVEIMRQFLDRFGDLLPSSIRTDQPERYANDYYDLIREFVQGLQRSSSIFRRL